MTDEFKKARDEEQKTNINCEGYNDPNGCFTEGANWAYEWCEDRRQYVSDGYEAMLNDLKKEIEALVEKQNFQCKRSEKLFKQLKIAIDVLNEIAEEDFRGNRPVSATKAYEALIEINGLIKDD